MESPRQATMGEVAGEAVRMRRMGRRMAQAELGRRMAALGHPWAAATVSLSERGLRRITVDELGALALVLGVRPADLLDATLLEEWTNVSLDLGGSLIPPKTARAWLRGRLRLTIGEDNSLSMEPTDGHELAVLDAIEELRETRKTDNNRRAPARRKGNS